MYNGHSQQITDRNIFRNMQYIYIWICSYICCYQPGVVPYKLIRIEIGCARSSCLRVHEMGLNKFVSLFTNSTNNNNATNSAIATAKTTHCNNNRITSTYNSELDIYGNSQRFKKSLLWSSLRKPHKNKGKF